MSDASLIERTAAPIAEVPRDPVPTSLPGPLLAAVKARLGGITAVHAVPPVAGEDDALRMGRGVTISLLLVAPFWLAAGVLFWLMVR